MVNSFSVLGATVYDGTGAEGVIRDVHVHNGSIVNQQPNPGAPIIRGVGLALSPGFIDVHTHDDVAALTTPLMPFKTLQGVTTVIVGNCGTSIAPGGAGLMGPLECDSFATYFQRLTDEPASTNVAALVGHGSVRAKVMGTKTDRAATSSELTEMSRLIENAMTDGAIGISTGLAYEPGRYSPTDELVHLSHIVAANGGIYTTHMRNEGDLLVESVEESIAIGEQTGIRIQISHLKAMGARNHGRVVQAIEAIRAAQQRGVDVMADQYPYTRGSTLLEQIVSGGQLIALNPNGLHRMESLLISSAPKHPEWEGLTLRDVATQLKLGDKETIEHVLTECGRTLFVVIDSLSEEDVCTVMKEDFVMIGSDGVPTGSKPHPRLHHTFPRVLGEYVRQQGLISLPTAIHKMTGMSAQRFGLTDRGTITNGMAADLVLFNPDTVIDTGTYVDPTTVPLGIQSVWVNGECVSENGSVTGARPGTPLRAH
jgi:N-acyl-D-amino-acid deacylase